MFWRVPIVIVLLLASSAASAGNCEAIRDRIEAKIRATGVTRFSVAVVDASAPAAGKVVGTCDLGTKKLVYQQLAGGPAPSASPPAPAVREDKPRNEPMLTECKDGSVSYGGTCAK